MLSEFRTKKITREFKLFDANHDGKLGLEDFEVAAARLVEALGWPEGDPRSADLRRQRAMIWEEMCVAADFNQSGQIDLEEYLSFYKRMTEEMGPDPESAAPWFRRVCAVHAESIGLGRAVDFESYERFIQAHGLDIDARASFDRLDLDSNGLLDPEECVLLCLQFYLAEDPALPGNALWGII